jgi:phage tail-like protein
MPISGPGLPRSYSLGQYALELDGVAAGWLLSADGGYAYGDVISAMSGSGTVVRKHLGKVKYDEITVTVGLGMSRAFYDWLKGVSDHTPARKNGAIVLVDFKGNEVSRLEFVNALISEITVPACDGASKDPAYMTVKWRSESTRYLKSAKAWGGHPALPKPWSVANFRLLLDGLDCTRVNKIGALWLRQGLSEIAVGQSRTSEQSPTSLDISDVVITLADTQADDFYDWFESFVVSGNNAASNEKNGTLQFLTANLQEVLMSLTLRGLGIFKWYPEKVEAGSDGIRRVQVELYCDDMSFSYGDITSAPVGRMPRESPIVPVLPANLAAAPAMTRFGPALRFRA